MGIYATADPGFGSCVSLPAEADLRARVVTGEAYVQAFYLFGQFVIRAIRCYPYTLRLWRLVRGRLASVWEGVGACHESDENALRFPCEGTHTYPL